MALNIGVNVTEVDGLSSPTIQAASTSVAAFVGLTERGVPSHPICVTNLQQFRGGFGNHRSDSYLAYAVEGFLLNGGQVAYINRVVGGGSVAASVNLNNRQTPAAPTLTVTAGTRGLKDPGTWGNRLRVEVHDDPRGSTRLQANTAADATRALLQSLNGFQVGSVVHFVDGANTFYRKITGIDSTTNMISWDGQLGVVLVSASTQVTSAEFRLIVYYQATPTGDFTVVEEWPNLSMEPDSADYVVNAINQQFTGSRYIMVTDVSGGAPSGEKNPAVAPNQLLTGGSENLPSAADYIGDAGQKTGFSAFNTSQVQLLAVPDAHLLVTGTGDDNGRRSVVQGALDYCAGRGDCMFVGSAPDRGPAEPTHQSLSDYTQLESDYLNITIKPFSSRFQANKVFGALYAPWIQVVDPVGVGPAPTRFVPPEGHVMGIYARTEQERGIWKAPAGNAAQVRGALDVSATFTDAQNTDLTRNGLVNGIRSLPGLGITVTASRTLSTDTRWWVVSTRLLFNFVKSSLRDGLRFVRQEPNSGELQRMVQFNVVTPFLLGLWRQGAFGSDPPEKVFSVKCDAGNNPPQEVVLGNFKVEVYFYPVKPAETIIIIVGQQPSGASAQEA